MTPDSFAPLGGPIQIFYTPLGGKRMPVVSHAQGIYLWDTDGRRYLDGSSGPVCTNIGHGNARVIEAAREQMERVAFASRNFFENEPNSRLAELLARLAGPGLERAFVVSGGSEAIEAAIKMARQLAVARGEPARWKVLSRNPSYHGASLGAVAVTGDPMSEKIFAPVTRIMPKVPTPFSYRVPDDFTVESYAQHCANALEQSILDEGPETVLAFLMEPVGGLATGGLVATDAYYQAVRNICNRHGVLLIFDEVMSGAGRTGTFLSAERWPSARPDIVTLAKGVSSGYTPLGVVLASAEMVNTLRDAGGFAHGHTYSANPLSCAIAHAALSETVDHGLMDNAARMGQLLKRRLETLVDRHEYAGDVRGRGLLMGLEIVANKETKAQFSPDDPAVYQLVEFGKQNGLLLYARRTAGGIYGEWVMISPPLMITEAQVDELVDLLDKTLTAFNKARNAKRQAGA
jgi:adenosylmethionine-8-amino-7-oxononanoate aminotransferase